MCGTNTDCGCGCPRQRRAVVSGTVDNADAGFSASRVNARVEALARSLDTANVRDAGWQSWLDSWRSRWRSMSGPQVTAAAESLAQYAQRLGDMAHVGRRQVVQGVDGPTVSVGQIPAEVKAVDDAISGVINAIAPALPYGQVIKAAHDARRGLMYGEQPTATGAPQGQKVMDAQALSRGLRRGDMQARSQVSALRAATDPTSRKRLAMVDVARRDDDARIERRYRS